ncbi:MAG: hypothetical protein K2X61_08165 [Caulobacteraceae bacterium]|nr:hypothetical protein [Caulobacteraceae bacterium]
MAETKAFATPAVVSAITGRLICPIGEVYEVLGWMAGEPIFTHQLPRVGREAWPVVTAMHPELAVLAAEEERVTPATWETWRDDLVRRFGEMIIVPRLTQDQHQQIDPVSELAEKVHPSRIVVLEGLSGQGEG